jgi:hypothetical protein
VTIVYKTIAVMTIATDTFAMPLRIVSQMMKRASARRGLTYTPALAHETRGAPRPACTDRVRHA